LLKVIGVGWEGSVVFPINNVSIIVLSTLIAILFFKEKLQKINSLGLAFALVAIALIALS
jgi:multidrug transporter EmrE-like cation transporter